jgi:hypothetical protein
MKLVEREREVHRVPPGRETWVDTGFHPGLFSCLPSEKRADSFLLRQKMEPTTETRTVHAITLALIRGQLPNLHGAV